MLIGSRVSISIGVVAVLISLIVGIFFWCDRRVFGGKVDADYVACEYYLVHTTLFVIAITLALGKGFGRFCCCGINDVG
jgi:peptide/nickel transport system permease protein